jgi:hypothetical protein
MLSSLLLALLMTNGQPAKSVKQRPAALNNYLAETVLFGDQRLSIVQRIPIQKEGRIDQLTGLDAIEIEGGGEGILRKLEYGWRLERDPRTNEPIAFMVPPLAISRTFDVFHITDVKQGKRVSFFWTYVDLPELVSRFTGQDILTDNKGEAILRMHNGEWSVESFDLQENARVPFKWTEELRRAAEEWEDPNLLASFSTGCDRDLESAATAFIAEAAFFDELRLTGSYIDLAASPLGKEIKRRVWLTELTDVSVRQGVSNTTGCGDVLKLTTAQAESWIFGRSLELSRIEADIRKALRQRSKS